MLWSLIFPDISRNDKNWLKKAIFLRLHFVWENLLTLMSPISAKLWMLGRKAIFGLMLSDSSSISGQSDVWEFDLRSKISTFYYPQIRVLVWHFPFWLQQNQLDFWNLLENCHLKKFHQILTMMPSLRGKFDLKVTQKVKKDCSLDVCLNYRNWSEVMIFSYALQIYKEQFQLIWIVFTEVTV